MLYTRDLVSGTEAEERGRKVEKVPSHGGIKLEPKVLFPGIHKGSNKDEQNSVQSDTNSNQKRPICAQIFLRSLRSRRRKTVFFAGRRPATQNFDFNGRMAQAGLEN